MADNFRPAILLFKISIATLILTVECGRSPVGLYLHAGSSELEGLRAFSVFGDTSSPRDSREPVISRYCSGVTENDCADFQSRHGECVNLAQVASFGTFGALYPAKTCYVYPGTRCRGSGEGVYGGSILALRSGSESVISSFRCFK